MRALVITAFMLVAAGAVAEEAPAADPDTDAARRHFRSGVELYGQGRFDDAIREFKAAQKLKHEPAFEYNIARAYDRLEKWSEAADAYERYLAAAPDASDAKETRARIAVLRGRVPVVVVNEVLTKPPPEKKKSRRWVWGVVVGAVVVGAGVGIGVWLGTRSSAPSADGKVMF